MFRFSHLPIQLLASTFIHSFSFFSLSLPLVRSTGMYTYLPYSISYNVFICVAQEKKNVRLCTPMYFSYVFPLKTLRTIGSMLNVSLFFICIMYSGFFFFSLLYNLDSDTCARLASFRSRIISSFSLYIFFFFSFVLRRPSFLNAHSNRR